MIAPGLLIYFRHWPALGYLADEAIASTMCGFNEAGRLRIVAEGPADLTNDNLEDGIADKRPRPDRVEQVILCGELTRTPEQILEDCEGFRSQLDRFRTPPQLLVGQIQAEGIERYEFFVPHSRHRTLPNFYGRLMTYQKQSAYCPFLMKGWQY